MGGRKHFIEVVTDHRVAFTRDLFERRAIDDVDETAAVTDESCALQQAGRDRHRGAAHAKDLAEKLLRQRDRVAVDAIVRLQQPAASLASSAWSALHATDCWTCASSRSL